jgi:sterol desaturase/sphingolipid hydroxylase (fatty acid hydroxylase superfamily)
MAQIALLDKRPRSAPRTGGRVPLVLGVGALLALAGGVAFVRWRHLGVAQVSEGIGVSPHKVGAFFVLMALFVPLERVFALRRQSVLRPAWRADIVYFWLNGFFASAGTFVAVALVGTWLRALLPSAAHHAIVRQPGMLQFAEAFLLSEISEYWAHRAMHTVPWLWRFHRVHHSVADMDWLASARLHPVDRALTRSCAFLPLFVLGFSHTTLGLFGLFAAVQALAVHANVRWTFGPLRYVLATPQYHHWHHVHWNEAGDEARNKNFASKLPFVDWLFRSLYVPRRQWPSRYGLDDAVPHTYLGQLAWPFTAESKTPVA